MDNVNELEDFLDRMQGFISNARKRGHAAIQIKDLENAFPEINKSDEKIIQEIVDYLSTVYDRDFIPYERWISYLKKQVEQKHAWSEEDERIKYNLIKYCGLCRNMSCCGRDKVDEAIAWIKFIKERVQPQLQREWSEDDRGNLLDVKCIIDEIWHNKVAREEIGHGLEELKSLWLWLDNLYQRVEYPQDQQKLSKEQSEALCDAIIKETISWLKEQDEMIGISFQEDFIERYKEYMKNKAKYIHNI